MMAGNETTRRRRVQGRSAGTSEISSTSRAGRSNTPSGHYQQPLHHYHDHHHHHYHYHHHYHHYPRLLNGDQEQSLLLSSVGVAAPGESLSQADPNYTDQQQRPANNRHAFTNSSHHSAMFSWEAASGDRDILDDRLWAAAMQSHRPSFRGNFLEEFSLLFEEDDDSWSDNELLERGIQEWLAAVGFEETVHSDVHSLSEQGLSKSLIRRLQKVVFVPRVPRNDNVPASNFSDQEDCSVCLEHFISGQLLICLPCKHRFHSDCLIPWLETHAKCPYCRAKISFEETGAVSSSQSGSGSGISLIEDDLITWMETIDSDLSQLNVR